MASLDGLQAAIGYSFKDESLLLQALTHPSFLGEHKAEGSNQRMEYLGDAVLELAVSTFLYLHCTDKAEGELSRIRAAIVSEQRLSAAAESLCLGDYLRLSHGELACGGAHKSSILSDALEAVFGAIYLDAGFSEAQRIVLRLMEGRMQEITADYSAAVDYKSRLQELVQKNGVSFPEYVLEAQSGPAHERIYDYSVLIAGKNMGRGTGKTKKAAQQAAAQQALARLGGG